jgi:hypothetical protein
VSADRHFLVRAPLFIFLLFLAGCATKSTVETRKLERLSAYEALPADQKAMVDAGQIRIGMSSDAVYIAWGKPSEILESEDPQQGHLVFWRYYGSWLEENRYWAYREVNRGPRGGIYVERYLTSDYSPRDYVRSEIVLKDGKVISWRTLPRPTS